MVEAEKGEVVKYWYRFKHWATERPYYERIINWIFRPRWIVNEHGEMGMRFLGGNFYYYKYDTPIMYEDNGDGGPLRWRVASKREFGECVHSDCGFDNPNDNGPDMILHKADDGTITRIK